MTYGIHKAQKMPLYLCQAPSSNSAMNRRCRVNVQNAIFICMCILFDESLYEMAKFMKMKQVCECLHKISNQITKSFPFDFS